MKKAAFLFSHVESAASASYSVFSTIPCLSVARKTLIFQCFQKYRYLTSAFERPEYLFLRKRIQPGDTLILTEIDRFGRNKAEILKELQYFEERHVRVMILEIPTTLTDLSGIDDKFAKYVVEMINRLLIELYAIDAEKEVETKKKRQAEGYAAKRLRGEWDDIGRPAAVVFDRFVEVYRKVEAGEMRPIECRALLHISSATYYRYRDKYLKQER